jgi:hypothetical protein
MYCLVWYCVKHSFSELEVLSVWPSPGIRVCHRVQFWAHFCTTCSDLVWKDLCHRVATFFNMLITLWCTHHITYFRLVLPWFRRPARHSAFFFCCLEPRYPLLRSPVLIRIDGILLPQVVSFKYLGLFFEAGLRWGTQARYVQKRCLQRLNFLKSIVSVWWGAHPHCKIMLYRGLVYLFVWPLF